MGILYKKKKTKFELLSIIAIYLFMFAIPILLNNKNEEQPEKVAHGTLTYREGIRGRIITIINDGSSTLELSCAENMFMDRPNCFSKKEYDKIKQKTIEQVAANKASSLFKNLPNNLPKFFKQFTEEYREIPVFSRYDMNDLYKKLCDTPNYDLNNFVNILKVRYEKKKKMLKSDSRNLKKLSAIIRDNENDNNGSKILKTALLKNIADSIDNLLK